MSRTKATERRPTPEEIARFHASRLDCALYPGPFSEATWRRHFEWDAERMQQALPKRQVSSAEVVKIAAFLRKPAA